MPEWWFGNLTAADRIRLPPESFDRCPSAFVWRQHISQYGLNAVDIFDAAPIPILCVIVVAI